MQVTHHGYLDRLTSGFPELCSVLFVQIVNEIICPCDVWFRVEHVEDFLLLASRHPVPSLAETQLEHTEVLLAKDIICNERQDRFCKLLVNNARACGWQIADEADAEAAEDFDCLNKHGGVPRVLECRRDNRGSCVA